MGGKSGEMECFEGAMSRLRRDPGPPEGLFDALLPQKSLTRRCSLRLAAHSGDDVSLTALSTGAAGQLLEPSGLLTESLMKSHQTSRIDTSTSSLFTAS